MSRVRSWVAARTTGAAKPAWWDSSQRVATTHQAVAGCEPGEAPLGAGREEGRCRCCAGARGTRRSRRRRSCGCRGPPARGAEPVAVEPGQRVGAAQLEVATQNVAFSTHHGGGGVGWGGGGGGGGKPSRMPLGRVALTVPLRPGWLRLELPWTRDVRLVMLSGMSGQVLRDSHGIPHLRAATVLDLARLQGVVTAEDRAWQLEWFRWRMEGRTAEYVGEDGVPWDRFARQVRLEPTARACYAALDDETRAWVSAYVDGVNEGMSSGLERAPELGLLGLRGCRDAR